MKQKKNQFKKFIVIFLAIVTIALLVVFLKDILFKIFSFQKNNDQEGAANFLKEKGFIGVLLIVLIESLQMIAVFLPTEFIQMSACIAYPPLLAILICLFGVFVGASVIYLLVHLFKFDGNAMFANNAKQIEDIAKRKKSNQGVQSLMLLLFFLPVLPIGAICYFGSSTKISYWRYLIVSLLGVLPSILSSLFIGEMIKYFLRLNISIVWLVLIVILAMIILFIIIFTIMDRLFFKEGRGTPNSVLYSVFKKMASFISKRTGKIEFDTSEIEKIQGPYLLLTNHPSFFDVFYLTDKLYPQRFALVLNRDFFRKKINNHLLRQMGVIPKKLFSPDFETIRLIIKSVKQGFPVIMCPEGRLSVDGVNYKSTLETGKLIKKLEIPVVLVTINGAYLSKPKWRKKFMRAPIKIETKRILNKEQINLLSYEEIDNIIDESLSYNDFAYAKKENIIYKNNQKAKGLDKVFYRCPKCHHEHVMQTNGNIIYCKECNFTLEIDDNYSFKENEMKFSNIHDYYKWMYGYEKDNLDLVTNKMSVPVKVKKLSIKNKKFDERGKGTCYLDENGFRFIGKMKKDEEFFIPYNNLHALPFAIGKEFECYNDEFLYYFYPLDYKDNSTKWSLIVDVVNQNNLK